MGTYQFLNLDYLNMMSDGDADMKATMIEMLVDEIPEEMEKMKQLYAATDWNELREVSHKMKSTLGFVGNDALTEANKEIEDIAKTEGVEGGDKLPELLAVLLDIYPKAVTELKSELAGLEV